MKSKKDTHPRPQLQYKQAQIATASQGQLLLMLYDAAIFSMEKAIQELEADVKVKKYDIINNNLIKTQDIIGELISTLDIEKGGEIAQSLQSLYGYFIKQLLKANLDKDAKPIKEVVGFFKELKESWEVAIKNTTSTPASLNKDKKKKPTLSKKEHASQRGGGFSISG